MGELERRRDGLCVVCVCGGGGGGAVIRDRSLIMGRGGGYKVEKSRFETICALPASRQVKLPHTSLPLTPCF